MWDWNPVSMTARSAHYHGVNDGAKRPLSRCLGLRPCGWYQRRREAPIIILIPFLTQPPHERTLTGRSSRVYPKRRGSRVRPGRGWRCARASPLAARARGSLYEFVLYNSYKKCMNWYKNHTMYEFVLYNLYNNCMNSFV